MNYQGTWTAWNKMSFEWRSEFSSGVLIQREQFEDLLRVDFRPELGLRGSRCKSEDEAEPARVVELSPCVPFVDDSRLLLNELVSAIRNGVKPVTSGRDHLRSLCLVAACIESAHTGRWVTLQDFYERQDIPSALLSAGAPD